MDRALAIKLPPGNDIQGFVPIAKFKTSKEASIFAHKYSWSSKISVKWDSYVDESGRVAGYAVYADEIGPPPKQATEKPVPCVIHPLPAAPARPPANDACFASAVFHRTPTGWEIGGEG